jgi:hypothetical protein
MSRNLCIMQALVDVACEMGVPDRFALNANSSIAGTPYIYLRVPCGSFVLVWAPTTGAYCPEASGQKVPDEVVPFLDLCVFTLNNEWPEGVTTESDYVAYCQDKMRGFSKSATKR